MDFPEVGKSFIPDFPIWVLRSLIVWLGYSSNVIILIYFNCRDKVSVQCEINIITM